MHPSRHADARAIVFEMSAVAVVEQQRRIELDSRDHRTNRLHVLRAGDDDGVEAVLLRLGADVGVAALNLGFAGHTLPLINCVSARLSGASMP